SEIGFARAFVRLALERRLLSRHLSELFSHSDLLQALYKREAFLHIDIIYHVIIVPTRARATGISSTTTANSYIALAGILGSTKVIPLPSKINT
ncbi:unnamed protein product, partial [Rotaria sp. Silwood1]